MTTMISAIHIVTCILLVLVIMIQSGKGAEISASFGGSSQTVFGSSGGANFFVHFTRGAAAVFFATSLLLTVLGSANKKSLFETPGAVPASATAPVQDAGVPGAAAAKDAKPAIPVPAQAAPAEQQKK